MRGFFILVLMSLLFIPQPAEGYLYSETKNYQKPLEIIEAQLQTNPDSRELFKLALECAMNQKDWAKAIVYTDKLLEFEPYSEKLLKNKGDLYLIIKDFPKAISVYEKLIEIYPTLDYTLILANLYMENQDFVYAQVILEPIYNLYPDDRQVAYIYLKSLLAQKKIMQAYLLVKNNHLEDTKEGNIVLSDTAMAHKNYREIKGDCSTVSTLNAESLILKDKLPQSDSILTNINTSTLVDNIPENLQSEYSELIKNSYYKDKVIFNDLLSENPNYIPTRTGIVRYYLGTSHDLSDLEELNKMPDNDTTKVLKAQAYYNMDMWSNAKEALKGVSTKEAKELKYKIRRDEAITLTPYYSFFLQQLADEFRLDIQQFGALLSKKIDGNKNIFVEYNNYIYTSGKTDHLTNVTNEFIAGVRSRANKKWEYRGSLGVKVFEFGDGDMIVTDSWIRHYFDDNFNVRIGFRRDNVEQSYLSAVGKNVNGVFTGRAADNKIYLEFNKGLPLGLYLFGFGSYGIIYAQNLPTNQYGEGLVGIGKLVYNSPKNKWINTIGVDIVNYNSAYQYNLLKISENPKTFFGGYFSPSYFNATTLNVKLDGEIKKWRLKYGISGFGGIQTAMSQDMTIPAWGVSPYISYNLNDNLCINVAYQHFVYAGIQRDQFIVNAVIRGFKKHAKS